jgi:transcriptional regulator with XRE-family HTH domain
MVEDISYINNSKTRVDSIDEHVSKQLRQRRMLLGVSQQEVAKALGLSVQQIQKYETGENRLSSSKLYQIAKSLQAPVEYFFEGIDSYGSSALAEEKNDFIFDDKNISEKEILNLINSFKTIEDHAVRKHILDLVKSLAKKNG